MRCAVYQRVIKSCPQWRIILKETILDDIQTLIQQVDNEKYIKKMERKSKSTKSDSQKKINKINKQMDVLKNRKRKFINLLADGMITHEEYKRVLKQRTRI